MRNGKQNSDDGTESGLSDLKKMFSAHVQENILLQKECSDLDFAKVKKLRELNHNESVFLRKYEKYAVPARQRRSSVDLGNLRSASRSQSRSQADEEVGSQKSLGRLAISSQCPYSLDSWNMMVDVDKRFLEDNKASLLRDAAGETRDQEEVAEASPVTPRDVDATVQQQSGRRRATSSVMARRHTLTPIAMKHGLFEEDTLEEEIVHIQMAQKPTRQRRHSLYPLNKMPSLPDMSKRRGSVDTSRTVLPKIRDEFKESQNNLSKSDPNVSAALHDVKEAMAKEAESGTKEQKGVLKNKTVTPNKPVANAVIFVRDENGNSERMGQNDTSAESSEGAKNAKQDRSLPVISESPLISVTPDNRSMKSVSFQEVPMAETPLCHDGQTTPAQSSPVWSRRNSLGTITLQHMVDSHHGAAKLRYVARLVREMEREAGVRPKTPEQDKTFEELQKCRYLRTPKDVDRENGDL